MEHHFKYISDWLQQGANWSMGRRMEMREDTVVSGSLRIKEGLMADAVHPSMHGFKALAQRLLSVMPANLTL